MDLALSLALLAAAASFTYFFCMRPMRRGRHCLASPGRSGRQPGTGCTDAGRGRADDSAAELASLRQQIEALKTELHVSADDDEVDRTIRRASPR